MYILICIYYLFLLFSLQTMSILQVNKNCYISKAYLKMNDSKSILYTYKNQKYYEFTDLLN